jgi:hypothetical protein
MGFGCKDFLYGNNAMKFSTYEVRTEEEFIGNILLIVCDYSSYTNNEALKALWVEAQEFSDCTTEEEKNRCFENAKEIFICQKESFDAFLSKSKEIFSKFCSSEEIGDDMMHIQEIIAHTKNHLDSIFVLSDDFSSYVVFIKQKDRYMLFSWMDVI